MNCATKPQTAAAGKVSRPIDIAAKAVLTPTQRAFQATRRTDVLIRSLPVRVWQEHHYTVRRGQTAKPIARDGKEAWYDSKQVSLMVSGNPQPPALRTSQQGADKERGAEARLGQKVRQDRARQLRAACLSILMRDGACEKAAAEKQFHRMSCSKRRHLKQQAGATITSVRISRRPRH